MSFIAKLQVDGEEINVLSYSLHLSQATDTTGKPTAIPQGGTIILSVESTGTTDLFDWMISPTQTKNGTITFYRADSMSKLKAVEFKTGHCVDYQENFTHNTDIPMQIMITISAKEVKMNESQFKNNWPE